MNLKSKKYFNKYVFQLVQSLETLGLAGLLPILQCLHPIPEGLGSLRCKFYQVKLSSLINLTELMQVCQNRWKQFECFQTQCNKLPVDRAFKMSPSGATLCSCRLPQMITTEKMKGRGGAAVVLVEDRHLDREIQGSSPDLDRILDFLHVPAPQCVQSHQCLWSARAALE